MNWIGHFLSFYFFFRFYDIFIKSLLRVMRFCCSYSCLWGVASLYKVALIVL